MTHQLNQYGEIIDLGVDLNAGRAEAGQAAPEYAMQARVTTEHPEAHPPGAHGATEPAADPNQDPNAIIQVTFGAWQIIINSMIAMAKRLDALDGGSPPA
jgi:hypothetical protein